jgi:hypothetical protein
MDDFEEALRNIDAFCRVLAKKLAENEDEPRKDIVVEPVEKLFRRKYIIEEVLEQNPLVKNLIPLPQVEEPLIDIFEDSSYIKVLMQCRCKDQKVTVHRDLNGLQICVEEECRKLNLPVEQLHIESMVIKCNNNEVFEVEIPKLRTMINHGK